MGDPLVLQPMSKNIYIHRDQYSDYSIDGLMIWIYGCTWFIWKRLS
jgi:hypothetical protein